MPNDKCEQTPKNKSTETNYFDQQLKIEQIAASTLKSLPAFDDSPNENDKEQIILLYKSLQKTLQGDFRPHYFFMLDLVEELQRKDIPLSDFQARCDSIIKYLSDKQNYKILGITKNNKEHFKIIMFFKALRYEVYLKTNVSELLAKEFEIAEINKNLKDIKKSVSKNQLKSINVENRIKSVDKKSKELLSNAISVLGIFIAIVMGVFGGETIAEVTIAKIGDIISTSNRFEYFGGFEMFVSAIILIGIMAFFIINMIYVFIFLLSRLLGTNISIRCAYYKNKNKKKDVVKKNQDTDCLKCELNCSFINNLKRRYPYIFYTEIAFMSSFILLVMICVLKYCVYDVAVSWYKQSQSINQILQPKVGLGLLMLLLLIVCIIQRKKIKDLLF